MIIITPARQTQSWFPGLLQMSIKNTLLLHKEKGSSKKSRRTFSFRELSKVRGLDHLRESLHAERSTKRATTLITTPRPTSSLKHYKLAWGNWISWRSKREVLLPLDVM